MQLGRWEVGVAEKVDVVLDHNIIIIGYFNLGCSLGGRRWVWLRRWIVS